MCISYNFSKHFRLCWDIFQADSGPKSSFIFYRWLYTLFSNHGQRYLRNSLAGIWNNLCEKWYRGIREPPRRKSEPIHPQDTRRRLRPRLSTIRPISLFCPSSLSASSRWSSRFSSVSVPAARRCSASGETRHYGWFAFETYHMMAWPLHVRLETVYTRGTKSYYCHVLLLALTFLSMLNCYFIAVHKRLNLFFMQMNICIYFNIYSFS